MTTRRWISFAGLSILLAGASLLRIASPDGPLAFPSASAVAGASASDTAAAAGPEAAEAPSSMPRRTLVICSPGSPGGTETAQPVMDDVARAIERAAGRPEGSLALVYHETLDAGLKRLSEPDAAVAMVPLPLLLSHGDKLGLTPRLLAVPQSGDRETWSLVARKGRVASPAALAGWQVAGTACYAESFVRQVALDGYPLPAGANLTFTARVLGALRRAASGENVAVLLDGAQAAGLASLPFGPDLEVLHRSRPLPPGFLCTVDGRLPTAESGTLLDALATLDRDAAGREALSLIQMTGFRPVDQKEIDALRAAAKR